MDGLNFLDMMGSFISILLSVIAYLLRTLLQDIKLLKMEQIELRELCMWLKAKQSIISKLLESNFPEIPKKRGPKPAD